MVSVTIFFLTALMGIIGAIFQIVGMNYRMFYPMLVGSASRIIIAQIIKLECKKIEKMKSI